MEIIGLAAHTLSLAEYLRPWNSAGITHFFCDDELAAKVPIVEDVPKQPEMPARVERTLSPAAPAPSPERRLPSAAPPSPSQRQAASKRPDNTTSHELPQHWQALLAKTRPAPILWTYEDLGIDLCGTSSPERSHCLRSLIAALKLPKGSSTFWPPSLPAAESSAGREEQHASVASQTIERSYFLHGIQKLRPKAIVHMGTILFPEDMPEDQGSADHIAGFQLTLPFTQSIIRGILYVKLPPMEQLARDPVLRDRSAVFLRTAFHGLPFLHSLSTTP